MNFQKITRSYFEDPYRTNNRQLAQELKNKKLDEKHPVSTEIRLLNFIWRPKSGRQRVKGLITYVIVSNDFQRS